MCGGPRVLCSEMFFFFNLGKKPILKCPKGLKNTLAKFKDNHSMLSPIKHSHIPISSKQRKTLFDYYFWLHCHMVIHSSY